MTSLIALSGSQSQADSFPDKVRPAEQGLCYDFRFYYLQKLESSLKFHVTLLAIFLRCEDNDERNCDNQEEISPEVLLWQ